MFFSYFLSILSYFRMCAANPVASSLARIFISKIREKLLRCFFSYFLSIFSFFRMGAANPVVSSLARIFIGQ